MLSFPHCLLSLHILVILKIYSNLKNLSDSNQKKNIYVWISKNICCKQKLSAKQQIQPNWKHKIKTYKLQFDTNQEKKYYITHWNVLKRKTNYLLYGKKKKKIINGISYTLKKKKKKTENLQDKVSLESYLFHLFFESVSDC